MLSKSAKYALKAVLYLSIHSDENKKVMAKDISKPINLPKAYTAKLLQTLVKANIISSTKGPNGGFYLTEENKKAPLINIVYAIEGDLKLNSCLLSIEKCNKEMPCPLHHLTATSRKNFIHQLKSNIIDDAANDVALGRAFLPL